MPSMKESLLRKIESREIVCGVVGLGYVGLPLAVEKAKAGFRTIGFDVQPEKVEMVNAGHNYIGDVVDSDLAVLVEAGAMSATTDFSFVKDVDFVAICVPTPLDEHQQPDISCVESSTRSVAQHLRPGTMVVLESTTYPGTTEELIKPLLEEGSGLKCGEDFYLGFSPERVDPGNLIYKTKNTPKVVGAIGDDAVEVIASMYEAVLEGGVTRVSSPAVAEMEKILENTYRNVNIGLVRHSVTVLVTCFVSVDAYSDSSREALNSRQSGILAIFGRGVLQVGDRTPSVAAAKGTGTPDFAEVTAVFSWTDTRPGYVDEDTAPESESGVPLMEHYTLRVGATPPANRKKE